MASKGVSAGRHYGGLNRKRHWKSLRKGDNFRIITIFQQKDMPNGSYYAFGEFRFDPKGRVLFRSGQMVPLFPKAIEVLACLMENPGQVTTKEDLLAKVWPDTFVEESTLTRSISFLRKALGDTPDGHAFILTIPKRGYRFVAKVREEPAIDGASASFLCSPESAHDTQARNGLRVRSSRRLVWIAGIAATAVVATALLTWMRLRAKPVGSGRIMLAVLPVQNLTGDPEREYISDGLTESIIAQLGRMNPERLGVIARTSAMTYKHSSKTISQIGDELRVQYVIESSLRQSGNYFRITTQLIRVSDQTHLWSED